MKIFNLLFILSALLLFASCEKEKTTTDFSGDSGTFTDNRDSQEYAWVKIGSQIWMAENLNYGESNLACDCENNSTEKKGRFYSWSEACEVAPEGWHLPSDEEWKVLEISLGMDQSEASDTGCRSGYLGYMLDKRNNRIIINGNIVFSEEGSEFKALYCGGYWMGYYDDANYKGYFWTATSAGEKYVLQTGPDTHMETDQVWVRSLSAGGCLSRDILFGWNGYSVRCVKD
jgi:uncharacterized protein (TIGR02145 family)